MLSVKVERGEISDDSFGCVAKNQTFSNGNKLCDGIAGKKGVSFFIVNGELGLVWLFLGTDLHFPFCSLK